ncbi:permease [Haladaptatus salinisoli]|uniref:permease n=1 Tax=Haladaptatus salinisoli TaxID=2884876 RepID=UPI001D0A81D9|nr:permease [Haladaptatus salinisoli]
MSIITSLLHGIGLAIGMAWETWWALVLGFTLTGAVDEFVTERQMSRYLGDDGWREVGLGTLFGIASSSCSFSAIATAKTLFKKGASPVASFAAFQFAATDLVVELGLVMWILLGWQFVAADFAGGLVAVAVLALVFRRVPDEWFERARRHVYELDGATCAACGMDASPDDGETVTAKVDDETRRFCCSGCEMVYRNRESAPSKTDPTEELTSLEAWTRAATSTVKEWDMLWKDIAVGFLIAGLLAALVPRTWWTTLFSTGGSGFLWVASNSVIAVLIGVLTFVCSVGNVPFALVLWQNGIAFGSVLAFIFADLIIPPIVNAYRRYYGARIAAVLFAAMFVAAVVAGIVVHYLFSGLDLVPPQGAVGGTAPSEYTVVLNLLFTPLFFAQVTAAYGTERVGDALVALPGVVGDALVDVRRAAGHVAAALRIAGGATVGLVRGLVDAARPLRRAAANLVRALGLVGEAFRRFGGALARIVEKLREAYRTLR